MWTRFVNWLGFETKSQKVAFRQAELAWEAADRAFIASEARRHAQNVITSPQVPKKNEKPKPPVKPTGQVRQEQYGYSDQDAYLTPTAAFYLANEVQTPEIADYVPTPEDRGSSGD